MNVVVEQNVGQWYCYRLDLSGVKPLDGLRVRNKLSEMLRRNMKDTWHFGNGFSTVAEIPHTPANPAKRDFFVMIWSERDRLTFDRLVNPAISIAQP